MPLTLLRGRDTLQPWQLEAIEKFCVETGEDFLLRFVGDAHVPVNSRLWFYEERKSDGWEQWFGFLWAQVQLSEKSERVIRVHALYLKPRLRKKLSTAITKIFETELDTYAREWEASEIGFYTRRNPHAFVRRLNRTAPRSWEVDSYVVTRRV